MDELKIVEKLRRAAAPTIRKNSGLILGIGDDCAIFRPRAHEDLLLKTDQVMEDVHFRRSMRPSIIGQRALGRALSDIAAMGGDPRVCLVSLTVPRELGAKWIDLFYRGLLGLARRTGTALAGGDLSHSTKIYCDVALCGAVPRGQALRRDGAKVGDVIYVSGRLGKPWDRTIQPRLEFGKQLLRRANSCMDISDGLSLDLYRLCLASNVAAEIESVPVYRGATMERALHGGEDYELLFTMRDGVSAPHGSFKIGRIVSGKRGSHKPSRILYQGKVLPPRGYDHFA
jgi:thiamine-monophosphate kinase